jgi:hypothetical protein
MNSIVEKRGRDVSGFPDVEVKLQTPSPQWCVVGRLACMYAAIASYCSVQELGRGWRGDFLSCPIQHLPVHASLYQATVRC